MFTSKLLKTAQGQAGDYEFSCVMIPLPGPIASKFLEMGKGVIKDDEVYTDPSDPTFGRAEKPHVTALYGIRESECLHRIESVLRETLPTEFEVMGFGMFNTSPDFDVVFARVGGRDLFDLNAALVEEFPDHENTHGEYKPHITLAYVKKGLGEEILKRVKLLNPRMRVPIQTIEFSRADGKTEFISMDNIRAQARMTASFEDED